MAVATIDCSYQTFLDRKLHTGADHGFDPVFMPSQLFDFQQALVSWAVRKGRGAIFADCGLGKTAMQLTWAQNVAEHAGKPVLILTPLAVAAQSVREGEKFGIECHRSSDGSVPGQIVITNYERLAAFNPADFAGVVCDESSILKGFDGSRRQEITIFMRKLPYRLLATATAAPNDYIELGTSSEALGYMGHMDMLAKFFKNDNNPYDDTRYGHGTGEAKDSAAAGNDPVPADSLTARTYRAQMERVFELAARTPATFLLYHPPRLTIPEYEQIGRAHV